MTSLAELFDKNMTNVTSKLINMKDHVKDLLYFTLLIEESSQLKSLSFQNNNLFTWAKEC